MKYTFWNLFALAAGLTLAGAAAAQSTVAAYPVKPVRVVIPWPPGGGNDIAGRIVMQKVSESLGQQFTIDNRGGAGGQTRAVNRDPLAGWERP